MLGSMSFTNASSIAGGASFILEDKGISPCSPSFEMVRIRNTEGRPTGHESCANFSVMANLQGILWKPEHYFAPESPGMLEVVKNLRNLRMPLSEKEQDHWWG